MKLPDCSLFLRRYGFLVLSLLVAAGCSWLPDVPFPWPGSPTPMPTQPPTSTPFVTETPAVAATAAPQTMTLQFWVPGFLDPRAEGIASEILNAQVKSFVAISQDVQVQIVAKKDLGPGGLYNLISTAVSVAPSLLPDLLVLNQHDLLVAAEAGLIQDMSDAMPPDAGYFSTALDVVTTQSGLWAFPYVARADQMAYTPGISPTAPISWTGVLTNGLQILFAAGPPEGVADDALLAIYLGSGGRVMDQGGQATLDRTSLERVYAFFGEMRDQGLLDAEGALGLADAAACWSLYQTGIGQLTSVPVGQFWQETREGSLPSWVPTEEGDPITILHTWGLAVVTQDPARQEVSLGLIRWLVTAQHMAELTRAAQLVPTRVQAIDAWALSPDESAFLKTLLSSSESALPPTVDSTVRRALQAGLTALLQRDVSSPESAASFALTYLRR